MLNANFGNITAHGQVYLAPNMPPSDLFWIDPRGHENFWCSVQGDTSGSSSSPRTECRETLSDSSISYNWSLGNQLHVMSGAVRVELAPSSGKVIVGQVHASGADNPFLMVTWWNGVARIDIRLHPDDNAFKILYVPCKLGEIFDYSISIDTKRLVKLSLSGKTYAAVVDKAWDQFPFYFKRGAYVIDHDGPVTEGGWVVYSQSAVSHTPENN